MTSPNDFHWRSAEGLDLYAADRGGGGAEAPRTPILCLHGLTRNGLDFAELARHLAARGRRVLAADVRGRGRSAWDPGANYTLPAYADDVLRLLDAAGIERALIVGTSMGGLIAMELATRAPDRLAGAVVNDVGPELAPAGLARIAGYAGKPVTISGWEDAAAYLRDHNAQALPHYEADDWSAMARRMFHERDGAVVPAYDPDIARALPGGAVGADPWGAWAALAAACPVLLLRGALSDLLDPGVAARMADAAVGVRLVTVPGVGHAPMLDEPAALAAIERFVKEVG